MPDDANASHLREIIVFLAAASLIIPVFHRLKISPVIGYLLLGLVIGPFGLGLIAEDIPVLRWLVISDIEGVKTLAEFGVVFLLFKIGLELSLRRLWSMRRLVLGLGGGQFVLTAALIAGIALAFGNPLQAALLFGGALAMSSTAIVMQLLTETRRVNSAVGRTSFAILLMQDIAVVLLLAMLSAFATPTEGAVARDIALALGKGVVAVAVILVLGRIFLRPLFRHVSATQSPELLVAITLLTAIGTALATEAAGLSMALGAFLAGLLLAESEFQHQIEMDIEPFKGLLLGLFFLSVGMSIDIRVLASMPVVIALSVVGLFAAKAIILLPIAKRAGLSWPAAAETALLMGGAGEFALLLLDSALGLSLVPADSGQFMLLVASLSMIATPLVGAIGGKTAAWLEQRMGEKAGDLKARLGDLEGHVVIAGFGRVGETVARLLEAEGIAYVGLDRSVDIVNRHRIDGRMVYLGDAARRELLARARIHAAQAVVLTIDDSAMAGAVVETLKHHWPKLPVFARARDAAHAGELLRKGASHVVPETVEASLQLGARVLDSLGIPDHAVAQRIERERERLIGEVER